MDQKVILIIDDDCNNVTAVKEVLEKAGFSVRYAHTAEEGLQRIKEKTPDLILLDLVLPDESGFKACHQIKEISETKDTPIIAISLKTEEIDKHIAAKCGIADYLEKPLNYQKLIYTIKNLLEG